MENGKDLYSVLGVSRDASETEIKKAYRKLSIKYHPDKQQGKSDEEKKEAEDMFKDINAAYDVLSDPEKKRNYDTFGSVDGKGPQFSGGFDGFGGMDDIFNMFSGGGFGPFGGGGFRGKPFAEPGTSIRMTIPLTIREVYEGCVKKVKVRKNRRCPSCHGTGGKTEQCKHCNGTGTITMTRRTNMGMMSHTTECPHCHGTGKKVTEKCRSCGGSGFRQAEEVIEIDIPAGLQNGTAVQMRGYGNESPSVNGPSGDFIGVIKWNFGNEYEIDGLDIIQHVKIPYEKCVAGTTLAVTLPDEKIYNIRIPELTPPGKQLKLAGKGIKGRQWSGEMYGNYYIEVEYALPETLSDEERAHLLEIERRHATAGKDTEE